MGAVSLGRSRRMNYFKYFDSIGWATGRASNM